MSSTASSSTGSYANQLEKFVALMDKLWQEHLTSPTIAGPEKFYAWGNLDYVVIMSEKKFDDLVELKTKIGCLEIKKDSDGKINCQVVEDKTFKKKATNMELSSDPQEILSKAITALTRYYYSNSN
ncbi:MAG: hypothetical protein WAQ98_26420 [Blastocatellia bacterium]